MACSSRYGNARFIVTDISLQAEKLHGMCTTSMYEIYSLSRYTHLHGEICYHLHHSVKDTPSIYIWSIYRTPDEPNEDGFILMPEPSCQRTVKGVGIELHGSRRVILNYKVRIWRLSNNQVNRNKLPMESNDIDSLLNVP